MGEDVAEAAGLVARMDKLAKETPKLKAYVVFQGGAEVRAAIEKLAADKSIKIPLTVPKAEADAMKRLGINADARSTLMLYKAKKVVLNSVNVTSDSFKAVADAAKKLIQE